MEQLLKSSTGIIYVIVSLSVCLGLYPISISEIVVSCRFPQLGGVLARYFNFALILFGGPRQI